MAEDYKLEIELIGKKAPSLGVTWQVRELIEQIMTPLLSKPESDRIYQRLSDVFRPRAKERLGDLLKQVCPDPSKGTYRVAIAMKLFGELYADELSGWGGGGRGYSRKETPLSTTLKRGR